MSNTVTGQQYRFAVVFLAAIITVSVFIIGISPLKGHASTATTYYVSSSEGSDSNDGLSKSAAWKSLEKVSSADFQPGDKILFKAGDVWNGTLKLREISGTKEAPIIFDKYGSSDPSIRPIIHGNGTTTTEVFSIYTYYDGIKDKTQSATIDVLDGSYLEFNNFEITNYNEDVVSQRAGISIKTSATNQEEWMNNPHKGITIRNNYVHDVNGNPKGTKAGSGGILLLGNISDVLVENNRVEDVDIEGIRNSGLYKEGDIKENFPKVLTNVQFRNNYVARVQGDGMVLSNIGEGGRMEYNTIVKHSNKDVGNVNYAGLWVIAVKDTIVQYNEVYGGKYGYNDGEAFDIDMFSEGAVFQYNYSHNNNGGFMLFMGGSTNSVVRYNISDNDGGGDGQEIFHYLSRSENDAPLIYNNSFFTDSDINTRIFNNDLGGKIYPKLYNNIFMAKGKMTMGETMFNGGEIKNNVFYPGSNFKNQNLTGVSFEDNIFKSPKLSSPGEEPHDVITDHDTFNTAKLDGYKLMHDSPLIDNGLDVTNYIPEIWDTATKDFFTNEFKSPVDIGAHEYSDDQPDNVNPEILPDSITLDKEEIELNVNQLGGTLHATVLPDDAWFKGVKWSSSDPSVATVNKDGYVSAMSDGTAVITVESVVDPNVSATCIVTVEDMEGVYFPVDDSFIRGGQYADTNFGSDSALSVKRDTPGYTRKSYLKFNLSNIGSGEIQSAVLRLYAKNVNSDPKRTINVYSTDSDWSEFSITWNNALEGTKFLTSTDITKEGQWYEFDVTDYMRSGTQGDIVSFLLANEGAATSKNDVAFVSKEGGANKPQLIVTRNDISADGMKNLVERFEADGEFKNHGAAQSLKVHLIAVDRYEEKELAEKVIKHMKGFKRLLDHQKENELISKKAYDILKDDANSLIKKWQ